MDNGRSVKWWDEVLVGWPLPEGLQDHIEENVEFLSHGPAYILERLPVSFRAWIACRFAERLIDRRQALAFSARAYGELCRVLPSPASSWSGMARQIEADYPEESASMPAAPVGGTLDDLLAYKDLCDAGVALFESIQRGWNARDEAWPVVAHDVAKALALSEYPFARYYHTAIDPGARRRISAMLKSLDHIQRLLASEPWQALE